MLRRSKGGSNVKLGLVPIFLYPKGMYNHYRLQIINRELGYRKQAQPYLDQFDAEKDYVNGLSASKLIKGVCDLFSDKMLPTSVKKTYTDADGKFEITHNLNSFILIAKGQRLVGGNQENYSWEISSDKIEKGVPLFLSNQNMDW